jgi:hypothetical protein
MVALPEDLPNECIDERRLAEIFKKLASSPLKKVLKAVLRKWKGSHTRRAQGGETPR